MAAKFWLAVVPKAASVCRQVNSSAPLRFKLPRNRMLKRRAEIREVLEQGKRHSGKYVNIFIKTADRERFAVLVPRRLGNAVKRNRMKRLAREIYRLHPDWFRNVSVVFFIKRYHPKFADLLEEIHQLVKK